MPILKKPSKKDLSESKRTAPLAAAYETQRRMLAKGGSVAPKPPTTAVNCVSRPDKGWGAIICKADGGEVESTEELNSMKKPKLQSVKTPRMVESSLKVRAANPFDADADDDANSDIDKDKMAKGGVIKKDSADLKMKKMAEGVEVEDERELEHAASIAASIMSRRKRMAEGGRVDLDENAEEQPNQFYSANKDILKENYDSDLDDMDQPLSSNLHGVDLEDENESGHSLVEKIMRKARKISPMTR